MSYTPPTAVLYGNPEEAVIAHLQTALASGGTDADVSDRVPAQTQSRLPFIIVERVGGPTTSIVTEDPTLVVESWAKDWRVAHDRLQLARRAIASLPGTTIGGLMVYRVAEVAGPGRLPVPDSNIARWTYTPSIRVRST